MENGFVTEFTAGDACGLYVTQNGKVTSENIKLTLTQADGKLEWTLPQGTTLHFNSSDRYFLYYPYQETLLGTVDPNADDDAAFFADVISKWTPKTDQSNYQDGYTASDLMTAAAPLSPVKNEDGRINLPFSMTHRMAMAVIEVPRTIYRFTNSENGGIPDYVTSADFGENKPYKTTSGSYRYIVPPSAQIVPTIIGSYADGVHKKKFRIVPAGIIANSYKTYNVNGAKVTQIEHQLQVGDFFLADGRVLPKDTDISIVRVANVVGIVFQTDRNRIGAKEKEKLGGEGNAHGLVMSVKRTPANERWSAIYEKDGLKKCKLITTTTSTVTAIVSISEANTATSTIIPHSRQQTNTTRLVRFQHLLQDGIFLPPVNGGTFCKIWAVVRIWQTKMSRPRQKQVPRSAMFSSGIIREIFQPP